ncbi:hypothetical protein [Lactococcus sp.]|uniref:hypothetical protein n=1 Tax=Lactococcus sp. TaxID=44273 RepID=UPI0035B2E30C
MIVYDEQKSATPCKSNAGYIKICKHQSGARKFAHRSKLFEAEEKHTLEIDSLMSIDYQKVRSLNSFF